MKTTCLSTALLIGAINGLSGGQNRSRGLSHPASVGTQIRITLFLLLSLLCLTVGASPGQPYFVRSLEPVSLCSSNYDSFESYTNFARIEGLSDGGCLLGPYFSHPGGPPVIVSYDDFESYQTNSLVDGLSGGWGWFTTYFVRRLEVGIIQYDNFENYTANVPIDGLNGWTEYDLGSRWGSAYSSSLYPYGLKDYDNFETYAVDAAINGLNGGTNFGGPYISR